jgi:hypothetical protein
MGQRAQKTRPRLGPGYLSWVAPEHCASCHVQEVSLSS